MDIIYSILLLVNLVILPVLGVFIYFRNRRSIFNIILSFIMLPLILWTLSFFVRYTAVPFALIHEHADFLYWAKVSHYAGALILAFGAYFLLIFPERRHRLPPAWFNLLFLGVVPGAMFGLIHSGFIVEEMRFLDGKYYIVPGRHYFLWLAYSLVYLLTGVAAVIRKYPRVTGLQKLQLNYVTLGILVSIALGFASNILLPALSVFFPDLAYYSALHLMGPLNILFFIYCTSYAVVKHRMLDIEIVLSRSAGYIGAAALVLGVYIVIVVFSEKFLQQFMGYSSYFASSAAAILIAVAFHPLQTSIQTGVYNKFFAGSFEYQKLLLEASREIVTKMNLEEVLGFFVDTVQKSLGAERIAVFLRREGAQEGELTSYYIRAHRGINPDVAGRFEVRNGLVGWLEHKKDVFVRDEMELKMAERGFNGLYGSLAQIGAQVLVPIFIKECLGGIVAIDRKKNGRPYSQTDIDVLNVLAAETAISMENSRLYGEAISDGLTGLFNQRYFQYRLREELMRAERYKRGISLLMIDFDYFKKINDGYGHQAGDYILRQSGDIIRSSVRQVDIVCRYGGEEIAVILPETEGYSAVTRENTQALVANARIVAERIRKNIEEHSFVFSGQKIPVSVSIGAAGSSTAGRDKLNAESFVKIADRALYRAKANGRNRVEEGS